MRRVPGIALISVAAVLAAAALAYAWPAGLALLLAALTLAALAGAALAFPGEATVAWLLATALTPDMWLGDLVPGLADPLVAGSKLAGLALTSACVLRFGARADWFNPGLPFLAMFAASFVHGRLPELSLGESVRSLLGSIAPFAFGFSVLSLPWCARVIGAVRWLPLAATAFGGLLNLAGLHALFAESGGLRLTGAGHPAFLAGFALTAVYACLLELLRRGRAPDLALLGANLLILVLTGARAPLAVGAAVCVLALAFAPSSAFPWRRRAPLLLGGALALGALDPFAGSLSGLRLFTVLEDDAGDLSGRDRIWPVFEAARDASPWTDWGVGAGKALVSPDDKLARLLGTTAAHDEYLRIAVDGGWIGLWLLIGFLTLWTWRHTRGLPGSDKVVLRLAMAGSAAHAYTDNTLIATTASVMFAFMSAAFARGRLEHGEDR